METEYSEFKMERVKEVMLAMQMGLSLPKSYIAEVLGIPAQMFNCRYEAVEPIEIEPVEKKSEYTLKVWADGATRSTIFDFRFRDEFGKRQCYRYTISWKTVDIYDRGDGYLAFLIEKMWEAVREEAWIALDE